MCVSVQRQRLMMAGEGVVEEGGAAGESPIYLVERSDERKPPRINLEYENT